MFENEQDLKIVVQFWGSFPLNGVINYFGQFYNKHTRECLQKKACYWQI